MYSNTGGAALAATGIAAYQLGWIAVALFVAGGMLIALANLGPRIALDPVKGDDGRYRLRLTRNGKVWRNGKD